MKKKKTDIYFSGDDSHAFLPWVIGIMACMAALFLCISVSVSNWIIDRSGDYSNSFTVSVPSNIEDFPVKLADVKKTLNSMPGIIKISEMSQDKLKTMLKPWLGNLESADSLPLPAVLDVTTDNVASIDYKIVATRLTKIAAGTQVDTHEAWIASFSNFSSTLRVIMSLLAVLIIGGLALIIAFSSRAALKLHSRTVNLLHSIGAEDSYIMQQFQQEAFMITLRGTVPASLIAGGAYWMSGKYISALQSNILPAMMLGFSHILLLVILPLACAGIAWIAARISVNKQLQRVL